MFGGCDVVAVDYMCDDAVSLVFEVNHSPHFSRGSRDGENGFPCGCVHVEGGGGKRMRRRRRRRRKEETEGKEGGRRTWKKGKKKEGKEKEKEKGKEGEKEGRENEG